MIHWSVHKSKSFRNLLNGDIVTQAGLRWVEKKVKKCVQTFYFQQKYGDIKS